MLHDSREMVPTFLVYAGGWLFLAGVALAWGIGAAGPILLEAFGRPIATVVVAAAGGGATLLMQWLLIGAWRRSATPKAPKPDSEPIRLTPDKRERLQTGQRA